MTVEASFLLPVFLMLFMNLLSIIEVYRIHSSVAETLWDEGRLAAQNYYLKDIADESLGAPAGSPASFPTEVLISLTGTGQIVKDLGNYTIWEKLVTGGKGGFTVDSRIDEKGIITMNCAYSVHPLFLSLTPVSKIVNNPYYGHAWTGYELSRADKSNAEELYVYVTETGTVYHKNRSCSYLNPSIKQVAVSSVKDQRNKSGAIYYACPLCDDRSMGESCYITDYGTNYHTSITCSGLKRTIYEVKLSEVRGKGPCSKCGG